MRIPTIFVALLLGALLMGTLPLPASTARTEADYVGGTHLYLVTGATAVPTCSDLTFPATGIGGCRLSCPWSTYYCVIELTDDNWGPWWFWSECAEDGALGAWTKGVRVIASRTCTSGIWVYPDFDATTGTMRTQPY